ncbi:uncharacterized protein LOC119911979 [Micropterus salmoides]|uniref:uncharacterized protein LOC119911979 n=1 Tax=Micropterus salmoides TaxID=27706 RepID=UPI0018EAAEB8|nr:uncharacterized protein LOC119911979 [Micropterus salmoides]
MHLELKKKKKKKKTAEPLIYFLGTNGDSQRVFVSSVDSVDYKLAKTEILRGFIAEKLTTAAQEIFAVVERTVAGYEEEASGLRQEIDRQRRQLEAVLQPRVSLCRTDHQFPVCEPAAGGAAELPAEEEQQHRSEQNVEDSGSRDILGHAEEEEGEDEEEESAEETVQRTSLDEEDLGNPDHQITNTRSQSVKRKHRRRSHLDLRVDSQSTKREAPHEHGLSQRPVSASPPTDDKLLAAISGLSRQLTQFIADASQQFSALNARMLPMEERMAVLESNNCSGVDERKRKRRVKNPKIARRSVACTTPRQTAGAMMLSKDCVHLLTRRSRPTWLKLCKQVQIYRLLVRPIMRQYAETSGTVSQILLTRRRPLRVLPGVGREGSGCWQRGRVYWRQTKWRSGKASL